MLEQESVLLLITRLEGNMYFVKPYQEFHTLPMDDYLGLDEKA